jgi:hypothetical protein
MDQQQDQHPVMSGDDELAKALQGGLQFEETPVPGAANDDKPKSDGGGDGSNAPAPTMTDAPDPLAAKPQGGPADDSAVILPTPPAEEPTVADDKPQDNDEPAIQHTHEKKSISTGNSNLDKIKTSALEELRPLVGKLNLPADEKFDTLLLIIRSTDDQTLLDEAHDAAKEITDDTKRAQALLDIIKEIDYFSTKR